MGTIATTQFLNDMNRLYQPEKDQDFLNYVVWNYADIPDRSLFIKDSTYPDPLPYILEACQKMESLGADFIAIPCNTAHYFYDQLVEYIEIPILNMLDLVGKYIRDNNIKKVGIMATEGTLEAQLFHEVILEAGADFIEPTDDTQKLVTSLIYEDIKAGGGISFDKYEEILNRFYNAGADYVVLGCTELSYAESQMSSRHKKVIDSQELLIKKTIRLGKQIQEK